ncbi:MAG: hypothetical protein AAFV33_15120 [Chloroflexota bacterium]
MNRSLAWRLWHLMRNPPAHNYLYTRTYHEPETVRTQSAAVVFGVIVGMFLLSGGVAVLVLFVPLLSPVMGAVWAYGVSGSVRNRVLPHISLLAAAPDGTLGAYLHTALGLMHRRQRFNDLVGVEIATLRTVGSIVINLPLMWWLVLEPVDEMRLLTLLGIFVASTALTRMLFWLVHLYCTQVGLLVALVAATFRVAAPIVQAAAVLIYMVIAGTTVTVLGLVLRFIYGVLPVITAVIWLQLVLALLLAVFGELTVRGLWAMLVYRLGAHTDAQILLNPRTF